MPDIEASIERLDDVVYRLDYLSGRVAAGDLTQFDVIDRLSTASFMISEVINELDSD